MRSEWERHPKLASSIQNISWRHHDERPSFVLRIGPRFSRKPQGGRLILLIEDDRELPQAIRLDLEAGGHTVHVAETIAEGLHAARSGEAAALVVDRLLDGENRTLHRGFLAPGGKWTPALVIRGPTSVEQQIAGLKAGSDDYLVKPFDVRELTARVEALLRRGGDMGVVGLLGRRPGNGSDRPNG